MQGYVIMYKIIKYLISAESKIREVCKVKQSIALLKQSSKRTLVFHLIAYKVRILFLASKRDFFFVISSL